MTTETRSGESATEAGRRFIERHGTGKQLEILAIEAEAVAADRNRIKRALPLAPESPLPAAYARGWWDALNLCLDAIGPDRPRAVVVGARESRP